MSWVLFFSHVSYSIENDVIILNNIQDEFQKNGEKSRIHPFSMSIPRIKTASCVIYMGGNVHAAYG
jgi:hypothetical protein